MNSLCCEFLPLYFSGAADKYLTARHNEVMSARYHVSTQAGCAGIATMGVFLKLVLRGFWGLLVPCPSLFLSLSFSLSLSFPLSLPGALGPSFSSFWACFGSVSWPVLVCFWSRCGDLDLEANAVSGVERFRLALKPNYCSNVLT